MVDYSIVVTGVVGVAGIIGAVVQGRSQSLATLQLAREERIQRRLEQSYVELRRLIDVYDRWGAVTMPGIAEAGVGLYPPAPDPAVTTEAMTLQVYWSRAVSKLMREWIAANNRLITLSRATHDMHDQADMARERLDYWQQGQAQKMVVGGLSQQIIDQMSDELRDERTRVFGWKPKSKRIEAPGAEG